MSKKLSLIIPTYNEKGNLELLYNRIKQALDSQNINYELIVVDDDSPDGTWAIAQRLAQSDSRLKVIRRLDNKDLSTAVTAGWELAEGEILGVMDADLQHPPEMLFALFNRLSSCKNLDIVIASRYVKGGGISEWSFVRKISSLIATSISSFFLPEILTRIKDPMSGFFLIRREVIKNKKLDPKGYKILLEVLSKGNYRQVEEVPFIFETRRSGDSKLTSKQLNNFIFHILKLSFQTGEIFRLLKYILVGLTGVVITIVAYLQLVKISISPVISYIIALETTIFTNFLLNEVWTFKDKSKVYPALKSRITRFLKFNFICTAGALISLIVFVLSTRVLNFKPFFGACAGVFAGFIWNFAGSANIAWVSKLYQYISRTEGDNFSEKA